MKKISAFVLAMALAFSLSANIFASELISVTLEGEDSETGNFVPGRTYYLEAMDGSSQLDDDFFKYFRAKVEVTQGSKFVTGAKFIKMSNGYYRLTFKVNPNYGYKNSEDVEIKITATDKEDKKTEYITLLNFTVGYGQTVYCSDNELTIYPKEPVVEFDEYLKGSNVKISFDEVGSYEFKVGTAKMINFAFTSDANPKVEDENYNAVLTFLSFYGRPRFATAGTLSIYAPDAKYLYQIESDNTLTRITAPRNQGSFIFKADTLGSYVASDIALKSTGTISGGTTETTPETTTPDNTNTDGSTVTKPKPNPSTGAAA